MSRLLGLDLGARRIGVAVADGDGSPARPLATLTRARTLAADAAAVARLAAEQAANELVVGLPLEASGADGPQAALSRDWAAEIERATGLVTTLRDERLSSHLAEDRLGPMPRGRSGGPPTASQRKAYRARLDREAAAIILQDELDARAAASPAARTAATPAAPVTDRPAPAALDPGAGR